MLFSKWDAMVEGALPAALRMLERRRPGWVLFCARAGCRGFCCTASWLRRDGIELQGQWLCSSACLVASLTTALNTAPRRREFAVPPRLPYRLALLRLGYLCEADLQRALADAANAGAPLGAVLLESGAITEDQLAMARAMESACAQYRLPAQAVAPEYRLPLAIGEIFQAVTVHGSEDRWLIGFVERVDRTLLTLAESVTGTRPEGCMITATRRGAQVEMDGCVAAVVAAETRTMAVEHLEQCALQSGAESLRVGLEGDLVWACFSGSRAGLDSRVLRVGLCAAEGDDSPPARRGVPSREYRHVADEKETTAPRTKLASCR